MFITTCYLGFKNVLVIFLFSLTLAACINAPTPTSPEQTKTPLPTEIFTPQPAQTPFPTLSAKQQAVQYAQTALKYLGQDRYEFLGFFEFSLPDTWHIHESEFWFNSTSGRYTFIVDRDSIIGNNGKEFTPSMEIIIYSANSIKTAQDLHSFFTIFNGWCANGKETSLPSNFLFSPSSIGYKCITKDFIRHTVYENHFLYEMTSPVDIFPKMEAEFLYFFQNVTYKK